MASLEGDINMRQPKAFSTKKCSMEGDFRLLSSRTCSTSTPFVSRAIDFGGHLPAKTPLWNLQDSESQSDVEDDSGVNEMWVSQTFAESCSLSPKTFEEEVISKSPTKRKHVDDKSGPCEKLSPRSLVLQFLCHHDTDSEDEVFQSEPLSCDYSDLGCVVPGSDTIHRGNSMISSVPCKSWFSHSSVLKNNTQSLQSSGNESSHFAQTPDSGYDSQDFSFYQSQFDTPSHPDIEKVLLQFLPAQPDRLIGRKCGSGKLDIISELSRHLGSSSEPLSKIMGYLSNEDLCRVCRVNRSWKEVCDHDAKATKRRKTFLQIKFDVEHKENMGLKRGVQRGLTKCKMTLGAVQTLGSCQRRKLPTSPISTPSSRGPLYWKEAANLVNDESFRKCPRCSHPAKTDKVQERAWCKKKTCCFDFCIKCLGAFHGAVECGMVAIKKSRADSSVGTKKSKRNLRRL